MDARLKDTIGAYVAAQVRRAAEVYDDAAAAGQPPAAEVARQLGLPRSTASRRIKMARERGLLPAANGTRIAANPITGPHQPATAEVNRGRPGSFKVRICVTCITRWPCAASSGAD